jgi:CDP-diacylglycerol--glycerol-3-phosphate 3-phosphatidyltransferase
MFGRVVDPFADKVLICGTLIMLLEFPAAGAVMQSWFVVVIVAREFLVTTIRGLAEANGIPFPAERLGKYKMVAQCVLGCALLTLVAGTTVFHEVAVVSLWVTLVLTLWSGASYAVRARRILFAS